MSFVAEDMSLKAFREFRDRMNSKILAAGDLTTKRFFALDRAAYEPGALSVREKELMGLTASAVLRCNDCIAYHLLRCVDESCSDAEIKEALAVALVVGGSIVIPHLRFAYDFLEKIHQE